MRLDINCLRHLKAEQLPRLGFVLVFPAALLVVALDFWLSLTGMVDIRGVDMNVVYTLLKTMRGLPLYTNPENVPFDAVQYAPVYYLVVLASAKALGISDQAFQVTCLARVLSQIFGLLLGMGAYLFGRSRIGLSRCSSGVVASLVLITSSPWFAVARPDALAILLGLSGLAFVANMKTDLRLRDMLPAALLITAAVFTKQNEIQLAIVLVVVAYVRNGFRGAFIVSILMGFSAVVILGLCIYVWPHFLDNIIGTVVNGIGIEKLINKTLRNFIFPQSVLIGITMLITLRRLMGAMDKRYDVLIAGSLLTFAISMVLSLKHGSAENYFIEFTTVALLLSAAYVKDMGSVGQDGRFVYELAGLVLIFTLPLWVALQYSAYWYEKVEPSSSLFEPADRLDNETYRKVGASIDPDFVGTNGYVMAFPLEFNVALPVNMIAASNDLNEDFHEQGVFDYSAFVDLVAGGRLRYIVSRSPRLPSAGYLGANLDDFVLRERIGNIYIFQYNSGADRR